MSAVGGGGGMDLNPPAWVLEDGYRMDGIRIPLKGDEIWSPVAGRIVYANGEEIHPRAVLVYEGPESGFPPTHVAPENVCPTCHRDWPKRDEVDEGAGNLLLFPQERVKR